MMQRLLMALGYACMDVDAVASTMAQTVLNDFEPETLDPASCVRYFKVRYLRLCNEYGLPHDAVDAVATKAWAIVAKARGVPVNIPQMVELYD